MAQESANGKAPEPVLYDGDQKLLAFLGAVAFVCGGLFWGLLAIRLGPSQAGVAAAAMAPLCVIGFLLAWGVRIKMEESILVTRWDVRRLMIAGLVLGVVVGALPYLVLRFKLEDPDFLRVVGEAANLPPAWRQ